LALDGGGMRGAFTLGFLGELEALIARETGKGSDFVLADYFDFIGGTSTGAIIATGLSLGWPVEKLTTMYRELGATVFRKRKFLPLRAWSKYPGKPLRQRLDLEFGSYTFGDPALRTTLMIVMHNRTTDSPWPLCNNPSALYNRGGEKSTRHNLEQRLSDLLAASTAAPAFFPSVTLSLGAGEKEFVDGGVTAHNNPALQMFLTATIPEYEMNWPVGVDNLLLISVGTGFAPARLQNLGRLRRHIIYVATNTPTGLMFAAANHNDVVCRAFGETRFGPYLDSELQRMMPGGLPGKLFTYARYNLKFDNETINQYGVFDVPAQQLTKLDAVQHVETLIGLGKAYAHANLKPEHLAGFKGVLVSPDGHVSR
jgi:patatin-like phospholipase/acyl hydrolase